MMTVIKQISSATRNAESAATQSSAREEAKPSIQSLIRAHPAFVEVPPEEYAGGLAIAPGGPRSPQEVDQVVANSKTESAAAQNRAPAAAKPIKRSLIPPHPGLVEAPLEKYSTVFLIATGRPPKPKGPSE
jgi:hypothetical protein